MSAQNGFSRREPLARPGTPVRPDDGVAEEGNREILLQTRRNFQDAIKEIDDVLSSSATVKIYDISKLGQVGRYAHLAKEVNAQAIMQGVLASVQEMVQVVVESGRSMDRRMDLMEKRIDQRITAGGQPPEEFKLEVQTLKGGEKTRRRDDSVFGKSHPKWTQVAEYAMSHVRTMEVPLTAKQMADAIRLQYPEFQVEPKSIPNRLIAMGFIRVKPKQGRAKGTKFWHGDGIPDGYGQ
jgi:hypothetical protein